MKIKFNNNSNIIKILLIGVFIVFIITLSFFYEKDKQKKIKEKNERYNMETIASFKVNHDILEKGMYISRIDGDIVTYDIRMKKPNGGDYLQNAAMHTFEHLFATYARNTKYSDSIIYVGPMGCRTGFYFVVRDKINHNEALKLIQESFKFIKDFEGEIPGTSKQECGNYLEHSLSGAKEIAADMTEVLKNWSTDKMIYKDSQNNYKNSQNNLTIGIIGAMDCEIKKLESLLQNKKIEKKGELTIYLGEISGHNIVLLKSGVGKVNAAVSTQYIIDKYNPNYIINTGIAGGIGKGLSVGDIVIGQELVQYDFDVSAIGYARGYMCTGKDKNKPTVFYSDKELIKNFENAVVAAVPNLHVHKGVIATGDTFVSDMDKKLDIRNTFNATAVEMEGCAIAQTATTNETPFIIIRAISDLADEDAAEGHEFVETEIAELSASTIQYLLEHLK